MTPRTARQSEVLAVYRQRQAAGEEGKRMRKEYPLELEVTRPDPLYFSKGHHDAATFCNAAREYWGYGIALDDVRHAWKRWVPANESDGEVYLWLIDAAPHSRGAFPVTCAERAV